MTNILVTGGAGFIGSHLTDCLLENGCDVTVVDDLSHGSIANLNPKAKFVHMDIREEGFLELMKVSNFTYVFHLAAQADVQKSIVNPMFDAAVNVMGTLNVLEGCRLSNVRKIIYSSTAAVYGIPEALPIPEDSDKRPCSGYGLSKMVPEMYLDLYCQLYGLDYTILRYSNVFGPRQDSSGEGGVIAIFLHKMLQGHTPIIFGDGNQTRDFIYVRDVCQANLIAVQKASRALVNVSSSNQVSINEVFQVCAKLSGFKAEPTYKAAKPGDIRHSYLDNSLASSLLGWQPKVDLVDGLRETMSAMAELYI